MKPPVYSLHARERFPAPVRDRYFTAKDYAAACMRTHDKRLEFNKRSKG